jgi:hypothetical protein
MLYIADLPARSGAHNQLAARLAEPCHLRRATAHWGGWIRRCGKFQDLTMTVLSAAVRQRLFPKNSPKNAKRT